MNELNVIEVLKSVNNARLNNKNKWYSGTSYIDNIKIEYKGYNTWLQIFKINDIDHSSTMDLSVKDFKSHIVNTLRKIK